MSANKPSCEGAAVKLIAGAQITTVLYEVLIPNLGVWYECGHESLTNSLTQLPTRHQNFEKYRCRISACPSVYSNLVRRLRKIANQCG